MDNITAVPGDLFVSSSGEFLVSDLMRLGRGLCCQLGEEKEEGICCPSATEGSGDHGENWAIRLGNPPVCRSITTVLCYSSSGRAGDSLGGHTTACFWKGWSATLGATQFNPKGKH